MLLNFSRQQFSRSVIVSLITASVNRDVVCICRVSERRTHRTSVSLAVCTIKSLLLCNNDDFIVQTASETDVRCVRRSDTRQLQTTSLFADTVINDTITLRLNC